MSIEDNGGPAYPNITPDMPVTGSAGMTLRDYFAAQAMQGMLSAPRGKFDHLNGIMVAKDAYLQADNMLEARKK